MRRAMILASVLLVVLAVLVIVGLIVGNIVMLVRCKNATEFYEGYIRNLNNEKSEILAQLSEYDEQIAEYDAVIADTADELQLYYDILQDDSNNHIQEFHTSTPLPFVPTKRFARHPSPTNVKPSVSTNRPSSSRSAFACWKVEIAFI